MPCSVVTKTLCQRHQANYLGKQCMLTYGHPLQHELLNKRVMKQKSSLLYSGESIIDYYLCAQAPSLQLAIVGNMQPCIFSLYNSSF